MNSLMIIVTLITAITVSACGKKSRRKTVSEKITRVDVRDTIK